MNWLLVALALPLLAAALALLARERPNLREALTLVCGAALILVLLGMLPSLLAGQSPSVVLAEPLPGLALALHPDPLGLLFALLASVLWTVTSLYSIGYMRGQNEQHQTRFYCFVALAIACTMGVALAANLFTLFVFYELLTLATYPLVTHQGTPQARRAGRLYLGLLLGSSIGLLLPALIWTWQLAGTLDFTPGGVLEGKATPSVLSLLFVLYLFGIAKTAIMPLHRWLPAAMVAPTPVSALLHAVAVVKAGVFALLKVSVYIFGGGLLESLGIIQWLLYIAGATVLLAALVALRQDDLKARLAYSTISQLGYVVLGALLANRWGIIGGGLHMLTHAFGKITLFFCAGMILLASGRKRISQMGGLGRAMPFTMFAFFVASLSIIGLPPAGGLWSKWLLLQGALAAEQFLLIGVLLFSSLLSVAYLLPIPVRAFLLKPEPELAPGAVARVPLTCRLALGVALSGCVLLFLFPQPLYALLKLMIGEGT